MSESSSDAVVGAQVTVRIGGPQVTAGDHVAVHVWGWNRPWMNFPHLLHEIRVEYSCSSTTIGL